MTIEKAIVMIKTKNITLNENFRKKYCTSLVEASVKT
jgi:hypothetical protein